MEHAFFKRQVGNKISFFTIMFFYSIELSFNFFTESFLLLKFRFFLFFKDILLRQFSFCGSDGGNNHTKWVKSMSEDNEKEILEAELSQKDILEKKEETKFEKKKAFGEKIEGKFYGIEEHYSKEGNLVAHLPFKEGVLHGEARRYDSSQQ